MSLQSLGALIASDEGFEDSGDLLLLAACELRGSLEQLTHSAGWTSTSFLISVSTHQIFDRDVQRFGNFQQLVRALGHRSIAPSKHRRAGKTDPISKLLLRDPCLLTQCLQPLTEGRAFFLPACRFS